MSEKESQIESTAAAIADLVARLEVLGRATAGAALAVAFPGWTVPGLEVESTVFVANTDEDPPAKLVRLIQAGGVPTAFLSAEIKGGRLEAVAAPCAWCENQDGVADYCAVLASHFVATAVADGVGKAPAVN